LIDRLNPRPGTIARYSGPDRGRGADRHRTPSWPPRPSGQI